MKQQQETNGQPTAKFRRRDVLRTGVFAGAVASLSGLLRAEQTPGQMATRKRVVFVHLDGGPPQLDTIDMKPEAPVEIRGEFAPIATSVPGIHICELLPKLASIADRIAFVRSLVGSAGAHDAFQCQSGFEAKNLESLGGAQPWGPLSPNFRDRPKMSLPSSLI
jgi:hypothetical protein